MKDFTGSIVNNYNTDVVIVGGGPAGICAACAAADQGSKVMLIEQYGFVGGMATAGLVAPFMTCYDSGGGTKLIRGLFEELVNRMIKEGAALPPEEIGAPSSFTSYITNGHIHVTPFDAEALKRIAEQMLIERGVDLLYYTTYVSSLMSNNKIDEILVHNKSGFASIKAKVFIDCTGDADVAARSGAQFIMGNGNGKMQPTSLFFRIGNVDLSKIEKDIEEHKNDFYRKDGVNYRSFHWHVSKAREAGDWDLARVSIGLFRGVKEDEWSVNTSRIMDIDGTDAESLTRGSIQGRLQVDQIFRFLVKYVPGCENARLLCSGSHLGIRETRHIVGLSTLTADNVLEGKIPEDSIMVAANSIDIHGKFGPLSNQYVTLPEGKYYGVAFGTMVPKDFDNLLVAGRCISAESDAAGAIRVMPPCMALGQAAGVAAALMTEQSIKAKDLSVSQLQAVLREQNVYLEGV